MESIKLLASTFGVAIAIYFIASISTLYFLQSMRLKMVSFGEALLKDRRWNDDERSEINLLLDTAWSFRVGLMLPFAVLATIFDDVVGGRSTKVDRLSMDSRFQQLFWRYFVSILASNLFATLFTIPLMLVGFLVHEISGFSRSGLQRNPKGKSPPDVFGFVEEPMTRAAHGMAAARAA